LTCAAGYESSKDFTCMFQDLYTAVYETPYPRCVKSPCRTAPTPLANSVMNCTVPKGDTETCAYSCKSGYGVNGSAYSGAVTCNLGTFVWDQPTACTLLPTTTTTKAPPTKPATTPDPNATRAPDTTTGTPLTTKVGETVVEVIKVASSMKITQNFPEGTTGDSLIADTGYVDSVESGIAAGLGGDYTKEEVTVTSFVLGGAPAADPAPAPAADPAPAPAPAPRRLQGSARRLPEMSLEVNYEIEVKDASAADSIKATLADPTKREAFTNSFVAAYVAA